MRSATLSWWQAAAAACGLCLSACGGAGSDAGATSTQTALGTGVCSVAFRVASSWEQGYVGNLTISTGSPLSGWTLGFDFTNGEKIQNLWNGEVSQSSGNVTVTNASYDAAIGANGSFVVGYVANDDGKHISPSSFRLNGTLCNGAATGGGGSSSGGSSGGSTSGGSSSGGSTSGGSSSGGGSSGADSGTTPPRAFTPGLHTVMGSGGQPGKILDGAGKLVQLHGADRSGTEFECLDGSFFDGPSDQASLDLMKTWNINAIRVPLNEDCWLGINGVPSASSGASYESAIQTWVNLITANGMVAIVDLHWTAPGATLSNGQTPMADLDHSPTFWSQVAGTFGSNGLVIFDLFNEPFITDWGCWTSGGSCAQDDGSTYSVAGMAQLLQAVRGAGANNVVILGGLSWSSDMSSWVSSVNSIPNLPAPLDGISIANVAASWHAYDFNGQSGCPSQYNGYSASDTCDSGEQTAENTYATSVLSAGFPLVIGESGISVYSSSSAASFSASQVTDLESWYDGLLTWAESQGQSYLAWSWDTDTTPVLISDYATGTPTEGFGVTYKAHLSKF